MQTKKRHVIISPLGLIVATSILTALAFTAFHFPSFAVAAPPQSSDRKALVELGQALFYDNTLSRPKGQSCASCHDPRAGWTNSDSAVNLQFGVAAGAVQGRFNNRRPPTIGYAQYLPGGEPTLSQNQAAFAGGFFYDGRAATLAAQIPGPIENPNEMNNTPAGVVQAVAKGTSAALFQRSFGVRASSLNVDEAFHDLVSALASYEKTPVFSPFSSPYDAYVTARKKLTPSQLAGLELFTGSKTGRPGGPAVKSATCASCHTVEATAGAKMDLFSSSTFHNIGIPKNPANPYYAQTNSATNPDGYNAMGAAYVDYGLGSYLYPLKSLPPGNVGKGSDGRGDYLKINGTFKTPTVRNVDTRPAPDFIKCYGHNGYFKSLKQIVRFYNTRNLTTSPGEVINFTEGAPYAHLKGKPLWPPPEFADPKTLVNPTGAVGMIGNLGLTPADEANLVAFLKTLSDTAPTSQHP
jgi:cytochrome c peroxidase